MKGEADQVSPSTHLRLLSISPKHAVTTGTGPTICVGPEEVISPTSVKITCDTEAPVYAYIAYGPITPGSEVIDWQMVYHTTSPSAHHVFNCLGCFGCRQPKPGR